jgi:predicted nucleic acid-binding Zn ribbon protein
MSDAPVSECPKCGKQPRRLFYPAGIVFKGSGFYKNDSRSASSTTDAPASAPKSDTASTSSDAKPAASDTPKPAPDTPTKQPKKD